MRLHHLPKVMALMKRVQREFHPYQNTSPTIANRRYVTCPVERINLSDLDKDFEDMQNVLSLCCQEYS